MIDMRTIIFSYIISNAICVIVIASLWFQNRRRFAGLGLWLADFVIQFVALLLNAQRGILPDFLSMAISNTLVIGGTILLLAGLEQFVGKRGKQTHNIILLVVFFLVHTWFTIVHPDLDARNINLSLGLLMICSQIAWLMLRQTNEEMRPIARDVGIVFIVYCVLSIARIIVDVALPADQDFFHSNVYDSLLVMLYQMFFIVLTFSLFLMVNRRLVANLERDIVERKFVEEKLRTSEEKFFKAFQASPDAITITRMSDGKLVEVNEGFFRLSEYTREEVLASSSIELAIWANPQDREACVAGLRENHRLHDQEYKFRTKSGKILNCIYSGEIIDLDNEKHILSVVRDITERKKMEEALQHQNDTLAALYQVIIDLVNRHDVEDILHTLLGKIGPLLDAQDVSIDLLEDDDILVTYAATPDQPLEVGDAMQRGEGGWLSWQAIDTRQPAILEDYSTWSRRRGLFEGHPIHAIVIIPIIQRERVIGTINFSRTEANHPFTDNDIYIATQLAQIVALTLDNSQIYIQLRSELAERKQIEEVLRFSQENFMSYFNMGTVGMCVTDREKGWVEVNDRLCKMLGYTKDELRKLTWSELTHPDDLQSDEALFEQALKGEHDSYQIDKRFIRKDGGVVHTSMFVTCQRYPDRSVRYFLASLVDITERIQQEQILRQTQMELLNQQFTTAMLEERQRLARNLHDSLSQSIHSLVLFSDTLLATIEKKNLERAKQIVERVQESARQSHKETRLLLYELQVSGPGRGVNLIRDLEERLVKVENHAGVMTQIVQEGLIEHIPADWHENLYWITIEALNNALKHAQARRMQIVIRSSPQQLEWEVIDDGRGFMSGKTVSGGMGLENMRTRARLLGGELTIESKPGKGTRVRFNAEIKTEQA